MHWEKSYQPEHSNLTHNSTSWSWELEMTFNFEEFVAYFFLFLFFIPFSYSCPAGYSGSPCQGKLWNSYIYIYICHYFSWFKYLAQTYRSAHSEEKNRTLGPNNCDKNCVIWGLGRLGEIRYYLVVSTRKRASKLGFSIKIIIKKRKNTHSHTKSSSRPSSIWANFFIARKRISE